MILLMQNKFIGVLLVRFRDLVAPGPAIYAPETRTVTQRETARLCRAVLEYSEFVPQEGLEPPTFGLE